MSNAHSITKYGGLYHYGVAGDLYRDGVKIIDNLFDGTRLMFARMPPSLAPNVAANQVSDYLFVSGGGLLKKIARDGTVSQWGIDPPLDGFTATPSDADIKVIDEFDSAVSWAASNAVLTDDTGIVLSDGTPDGGGETGGGNPPLDDGDDGGGDGGDDDSGDGDADSGDDAGDGGDGGDGGGDDGGGDE